MLKDDDQMSDSEITEAIEEYGPLISEIVTDLGIHTVVCFLAQIAQSFGDGNLPSGKYAPPDTQWLEIAAILSDAEEKILKAIQPPDTEASEG